ncbi:MAG TPA: hypothetical protein VFJ86_11685 [Usitatibacter sp.]|jgi:hypothetical protein|nr:hypothetical protein [Usitatibacter sp.]
MRALSWQERLDVACSELEVVEVARDYITSHHFEISRLPEDCKPNRMVNGADIASYGFALATRHFEGDVRCERLIHRMAAFFVAANVRLSQLATRTNDEDADGVEDRIRNQGC